MEVAIQPQLRAHRGSGLQEKAVGAPPPAPTLLVSAGHPGQKDKWLSHPDPGSGRAAELRRGGWKRRLRPSAWQVASRGAGRCGRDQGRPASSRPSPPSPVPGCRPAPPAGPRCPRLPSPGCNRCLRSRKRAPPPLSSPGRAIPGPRVCPHEDSDPAAPPASPPRFLLPSPSPARGPRVHRARLRPRPAARPPAAPRAMDAPESQPDPDGGDAPGHEPGDSPQDEFDFSILFDYDYLNPIEGRWRLAPAWPPSLGWGWGLGSGRGWGPFAPRVTFPGGPELELGGSCLSPGEREGGSRRRLQPPLEGTRLTLPGGAPVSSSFSPRVPGSEAKGSRGLSWSLARCWSSVRGGSYGFCLWREDVRKPKNGVFRPGLVQKEGW